MEEIKIQIRSAHAHWVRKIMCLIIIFRKRSGFLPVPARRRSVDAKYIVKAKACEAGICPPGMARRVQNIAPSIYLRTK